MKKRFLCAVAAFVSALLFSCGTFATEAKHSSFETELPLAKSSHGDSRLTDLAARDNGYVNYFITETILGGTFTPTQFRSQDYGETWKQVNMDWYSEIKKMYPGFGEAWNFHIADNGDIYCIASIGEKEKNMYIDGQNTVCTLPVHGVFKYSGGKVQQIPNIALCNYHQPYRTIEKVFENGDFIIQRINSPEAVTEKTGIGIYGADGQLKKEFVMDIKGWSPSTYSDTAVYGIYYQENGPQGVWAFDLQTGKKCLSIPFSKEQTTTMLDSIGVLKDGTIYVAMSSGLYKCAPGGTSFTKLIGGNQYRLAKDTGSAYEMACSNDGTVYLQIWFQNEAKYDDTNNGKQGRLYRYRPV